MGSATLSITKVKGPSGPPSFIYDDFVFWFLLYKMQSMMLSMFGINEDDFNNASLEDKEGVKRLYVVKDFMH